MRPPDLPFPPSPSSQNNALAGNMMLFGPDGLIKRYETPQDILLEFFELRMQFYLKRHAFLIQVNCSKAGISASTQLQRHRLSHLIMYFTLHACLFDVHLCAQVNIPEKQAVYSRD